MGKLKGTEINFCQATHRVSDLYLKVKLLYYLDGFEFGRIIICILLQNMPCREAQRTQTMQDGSVKPTKCSHIRINVKWVAVSRQSVECSLQTYVTVKIW
jgi:hypothetical protein